MRCSFSKCIFTSKTSHLYDELQIIHVPFLCLNELMNVALPFPFHGLHGVKALEISTPCRKEVRSLDPTQGIKSHKLTKLHQHSAACGSEYTGTGKQSLQQQQVLRWSGVAINPLPSLCHFSVYHLIISLNTSCTVMQNKSSWLLATPFVSWLFSSLLPHWFETVISSNLEQCLFRLDDLKDLFQSYWFYDSKLSFLRWSNRKCDWSWLRTLYL